MITLRSKVIRLAHQNPALRPHLLPLLREKRAAGQWREVSPRGLSQETLDRVWDMYKNSYAKIGLKVSSIGEMVSEYDAWRLAYDGEVPVAFSVGTKTSFGVKSGLSGSDGTPAGKDSIKSLLSTIYKQPGFYSEVSHAVEHIAAKAGAPAVCAVYVPNIIKKQIEPADDGIHYSRILGGVGNVTKILVGRPRGIPTTDYDHPVCPIGDPSLRTSGEVEPDDSADYAAHIACLLFQG